MLLAEVVALTLWVDTQSLARDGHWWAAVVVRAHHLPAVAIAVAGALLLLGAGRIRREAAALVADGAAAHRPWPWLIGHLAAFAAFAAVTSLIAGGALRHSAAPATWVAAWAATGLVVAGCWGLAVLPWGVWRALAGRAALPLAGGAALGVLAWGAGQLSMALWSPLARWTLRAVCALLGLVSSQVVSDPASATVGIDAFTVTIAPACSGCEGIGLLWVFLAAYFWVFRADLRFPHALLMVPLGTAAIWLANAVRIAALVAIGAWFSPEVAEQGFHSQAGWLAFNAVALGIVLTTRYVPWMASARAKVEAEGVVNPAAEYLAPLLALVGSTMVGAALTAGFDATYPVRVLATAAALWAFRRRYAVQSRPVTWTAVAIGVAVFAVWMALEPGATAPGADGAIPAALGRLPKFWAACWLIFRVAGSVVTVPIAEELAFRGYLTRRLIDADFSAVPPGRFSWPSFLISSALFGALHGRWLAGMLAGAAYALAYYRRGRLADPVVAHATTNGLIAAWVLATGRWSLWT